MKKVIALLFFFLTLVPRSDAYAAGTITEILNVLIKNNLLHDGYNNDAQLGKKICEVFGGNSTNCQIYADSISKGICLAGGVSSTTCQLYADSIGKGISLFNQNNKDRDWAWDQFYHSTGSLVWACRGIQTGRFAEKTRCYGKPRNDYRWPNK